MDKIKSIEELNREIEELREQLEEAKAANTAKEVFLSNMSHDIRTPMNAIVGMTALAKKHIDEKTRVTDALNKIETASTHLLSLINDVLDMSRINSGRLVIDREKISLSELIHSTMTIVVPQIRQKEHSYELVTEGIAYEDLYGDPLRLRQIFVNIIGNAVKYTERGGHILISFSEEVKEDKAVLIFRCKDNGIGMSEEFLKRVFEPFERVKSSTASGIEGTGLGMSIVKRLVEAMGGSIDIESAQGAGTDVWIRIPLEFEETADHSPELEGKHILIMESDEEIKPLYRRYLEGTGIEHEIVSTAEEAFTAMADADFRHFEYDCAVIGKELKNSTSVYDVASYLKKSYPKLNIILVSDANWEEMEFRANRAGIRGFVPLPLFRGSLMRGLADAIVSDESDTAEGYPDLSGKNILLVEDNMINREIAKEILSATRAEIDTAEDGAMALRMFSESVPGYYSLILMDIQMPVMNGYEASEAIRKLEREDAHEVPIIAMTANTFAEDIAKAREAGMNGHIAKPVDMNLLLRAVGQAVK